jgi:hypothetical protein
MNVKWKLPIPLCAAVLYLSACSTPALTQADPLADVPSPSEDRFISQNDATSTCIGDPRTPLCAVETFLACSSRQNLDLCDLVGVKHFSYPDEKYTSRYRIVSAKVLTQDDMTEDLKDTDWWKPGFVSFSLVEFYTHKDNTITPTYFSGITNPTDQGWGIIGWTIEAEQDPDDPGPGL